MVCLDNSEWMRNGDFTPTRMEAQHDAANLVCGSKTQQNPESTVGILTMAGSGVQVLCSPTDDMGKILTASASVKVGGNTNFPGGLQIAQLALKHRKNKNGGQRVVVFIGSPIDAEEKKLVKIAKQLKKGNVAVDIVSMGESDENAPKLQAFIDAVNKNNNSHLVTIPQGVLPSDVLITSPIVTGDDGSGGGGGSSAAAASGGTGAFAEFGGVDPNLDPELAIALRVSMEEARAEAERKSASEQEGKEDTTASATEAPPAAPPAAPSASEYMDEDEMLQQALMMSMAESTSSSTSDSNNKPAQDTQTPPSAPSTTTPASSESKQEGAAAAASFLDPQFVRGLLTGLPGVDVNNPQIQAAMAAASANTKKGDGDDEEDKEKKKKDGK
eukprot:CAMPEP_0203747812 /NCGR_PEP_ID=MMETSP0098-20131031/2864_1 /ASSEMBLY_ACC=CAM_ASM_000208 /TAXON_ID=96639 /ORGANISM=" , Strain NY0313808BC1" /LENGTH=385 /DNA_ID=CAMNT_0050636371 /DNA_START=123 /DNA_END=1280 /DNA_ORIENTATION=+